jgi:DNA-binding MarR family transcriptional regulator
VQALLVGAAKALRAILEDEAVMEYTSIEAWTAMENAAQAIGTALRRLEAAEPGTGPSPARAASAPTHRQGQFLAYIREYMRQNYRGVVPTHSDLQRFFNLTAPSVNSMLVRLEQRGFIRRTPGVARGIELTIDPDQIPPLDQPFKF